RPEQASTDNATANEKLAAIHGNSLASVGAAACAWDYSALSGCGSTQRSDPAGRTSTLALRLIGCVPRPIGQIPRLRIPPILPACAKAQECARVREHLAQIGIAQRNAGVAHQSFPLGAF